MQKGQLLLLEDVDMRVVLLGAKASLEVVGVGVAAIGVGRELEKNTLATAWELLVKHR